MRFSIELSGLKKSFNEKGRPKKPVLDIGSFRLEKGESLALEGASGCGKTTLLHIISGVLKADEGKVVVENTDLTSFGEAKLDHFRSKHVGYIFQVFNLLQPLSALENVLLAMRFGRGVDRDFAVHLLESVGLREMMHRKPRELSVGQQQRVAVARALANRPGLILADEPTGSLDPASAMESIALIRKITSENQASLLLASHDRGVLNQFERVCAFSDINRRSV